MPRSHALWNDYRDGNFGCRGCGLHVFSSRWRVPLDKGWLFFAHAEPASVLTGIDGAVPPGSPEVSGSETMMEVHCRRCACHLGHLVVVDGTLLHCINGTSLTFVPTDA